MKIIIVESSPGPVSSSMKRSRDASASREDEVMGWQCCSDRPSPHLRRRGKASSREWQPCAPAPPCWASPHHHGCPCFGVFFLMGPCTLEAAETFGSCGAEFWGESFGALRISSSSFSCLARAQSFSCELTAHFGRSKRFAVHVSRSRRWMRLFLNCAKRQDCSNCGSNSRQAPAPE